MISNSRNKIHQNWDPLFTPPLYVKNVQRELFSNLVGQLQIKSKWSRIQIRTLYLPRPSSMKTKIWTSLDEIYIPCCVADISFSLLKKQEAEAEAAVEKHYSS